MSQDLKFLSSVTEGCPLSCVQYPKMKAHIIALTQKLEYTPLLPAPNVTEGSHMHSVLNEVKFTDEDLLNGPIPVVYQYRGSLLYLENGDLVYRYKPRTSGGNGYVSLPSDDLCEPEDCYVQYNGEWHSAILDFVV